MTSACDLHGVRILRNLPYQEHAGRTQLLDLYLPEAANAPVPVVLWLHGGGWISGDKRLAPDLAAGVRHTNLAFASIDYRLSGQAVYPAALHDVVDAIRFLRTEAENLGLSGRVGLWGASAGGHLALLAALKAQHDQSWSDARVDCVAASYPPVDLAEFIESAGGHKRWDETFEGKFLGQDPQTAAGAALARDANPLTWVGPQSPPIQLSHGTGDRLVPHHHSQRLFTALAERGCEVQLHLLEGYRHGFLNPPGRLDVQLTQFFDDGRLSAEGSAACITYSTTDPDGLRGEFGFADIEDFFSQQFATPRQFNN